MKARLDITERGYLDKYIRRALRDQADRDYISARMLYQAELYRNFLWPSLQAVEKYLKAIMLFSYQSVKKKYGHDVGKLLEAVRGLSSLGFSVPADVEKFVERLTINAADRYLVRQFFLQGDELPKLDETVWHLRRYCQDFLLMPFDATLFEPRDIARNQRKLDSARRADPRCPNRFRLSGDGYLEAIMDGGQTKQRAALVWRNRYYYKARRPRLRQEHVRFENPPQVMNPKFIDVLRPLVKL